MSDLARINVNIKGVVQGVGFRFFVEDVASSLGIFGYVKNLDDGSVEVVAEGDKMALEHLIEKLKVGPVIAKVKESCVKWEKSRNEFKNFKIRL